MKLFAILITTVFFIIIMFFPSFASDPIENETVLDTTSFNVWELGLSVKKDSTTMLGSPKSKNYSRWIDNVQYFSPDHMIVNTLSRVVHTIEQHVITRDCAYIGSDFEKCINFIQRELKTIAHLIKQQDLSQEKHFLIQGKIQIYGIDNPDVREQLKLYWRTQEIKILGEELGFNVKFDRKE